MAVGFILYAATRIGRKVVVDKATAALFLLSALTTFFFRQPWVFPLILLFGGAVTAALNAEPGMWDSVPLRPPWRFLVIFAVIAVGALVMATLSPARPIQLFESFYRYGYLVFGGGQVVVPIMQSELVDLRHYMTNQEFLTGYGLVQGLPGPMFSFTASSSSSSFIPSGKN